MSGCTSCCCTNGNHTDLVGITVTAEEWYFGKPGVEGTLIPEIRLRTADAGMTGTDREACSPVPLYL